MSKKQCHSEPATKLHECLSGNNKEGKYMMSQICKTKIPYSTMSKNTGNIASRIHVGLGPRYIDVEEYKFALLS